MKKYFSFFRIQFIGGLQYRAAALAGIATQLAWGTMSLLMYYAFYRDGESSFPMTFSQLSSYIWLQQAFLAMFMAWFYNQEIFDDIESGNIAYALCRPCSIYKMWFTKTMAIRLSKTVLRCLPILIVAVVLPAPFGLSAPASIASGILFLTSAIIGFLLLISFSMLIYISAFYTLSSAGMRMLATSLVEFFTGAVVPLPFFPEALQPLVYALPFASMQNTPFFIYTGHISAYDAVGRMGLQLVWLAALVILGQCLMRNALKKVVVQGG